MALPRPAARSVVARGLAWAKGLAVAVFVAAAMGLAWTHGTAPQQSRGSLGGPPMSSGS